PVLRCDSGHRKRRFEFTIRIRPKVKRNGERGKLEMVVKKALVAAPECSGEPRSTTTLETRLFFADDNPQNTTVVSLVDAFECIKKNSGRIKKLKPL
ncbi:MAG: hypothetical protein WCH75_29515, partial [Candidatus Binatia bacterium]